MFKYKTNKYMIKAFLIKKFGKDSANEALKMLRDLLKQNIPIEDITYQIRDRLDYSCAIFDASGELCAQAAHIPVHLGSMAFAMQGIVAGVDWCDPFVAPILYAIPVQLLAYHAAVLKDTDVDQPRNLAKSVTVE